MHSPSKFKLYDFPSTTALQSTFGLLASGKQIKASSGLIESGLAGYGKACLKISGAGTLGDLV